MYAEWEKKIFEYEDGSVGPDGNPARAFADPVEVNRLLVHYLDGDPDKFLAERWAGVPLEGETDDQGEPLKVDEGLAPLRFAAEQRLAEAATKALDLVPWNKRDGTGLTTLRVLDVLDQYLAWMDGQKKSAECSPTTPTPTADTSRQSASLLITPPASGYGSTWTG